MIIFIDSNIFFNNWFLENPNFEYLFNFLDNTDSELFISNLVCEEIDEKHKIELNSLKKHFENGIRKSKSVLEESVKFDLNSINHNYSFRNILLNKTPSVTFFDYEDIPNSTTVERAIKKTRPFRDNEKGYRDTLIWLSFLNSLKIIKEKKEVVFINNNSNDFFSNNKDDFHPDLKNDITLQDIKHDFRVFESLKSFIDSEIDLHTHKFSPNNILDKYIYPSEDDIENRVEDSIKRMSNEFVKEILEASNKEYKKLNYISDFDIVIVEGMEDIELFKWENQSENSVFSELQFVLRLVDMGFKISTKEYIENKEFIDLESYSTNSFQGYTQVNMIKKILLNTSMIIDIPSGVIVAISINNIEMN